MDYTLFILTVPISITVAVLLAIAVLAIVAVFAIAVIVSVTAFIHIDTIDYGTEVWKLAFGLKLVDKSARQT